MISFIYFCKRALPKYICIHTTNALTHTPHNRVDLQSFNNPTAVSPSSIGGILLAILPKPFYSVRNLMLLDMDSSPAYSTATKKWADIVADQGYDIKPKRHGKVCDFGEQEENDYDTEFCTWVETGYGKQNGQSFKEEL